MSEKTVIQKLGLIQSELKAPKGQTNKFGGYQYRSAEDILEALKPILKEHGCTLIINDEIMLIGERYYVKSTATIYCGNGGRASTSAFAREPLNKKGMDESQITGSSSSYAKKYALNGLFSIDDTKDADFSNKHSKNESNKSIASLEAKNTNELI